MAQALMPGRGAKEARMDGYEDEIRNIVMGCLADLGVSPCPHCQLDRRKLADGACVEIIDQLLALVGTVDRSEPSPWVRDEFGREYRFVIRQEFRNERR
jgi:hypothetical protein